MVVENLITIKTLPIKNWEGIDKNSKYLFVKFQAPFSQKININNIQLYISCKAFIRSKVWLWWPPNDIYFNNQFFHWKTVLFVETTRFSFQTVSEFKDTIVKFSNSMSRWAGLLTLCFVPRGGFLYTVIVPGGGVLLPSSRVQGVCPGEIGFGWNWYLHNPSICAILVKPEYTSEILSPEYTSEIFHPSHRRHNTRASTLMLDLPFRKSCFGQKTLSYLGPKTWNTLPAEIKLRKNVNTFKHDIKKLFFEKLQKDTDDIFIYY